MDSNGIRSNRINYEDELIMGTANDALFSKVSAINTSYYADDYLKHFIPPSRRRQATKGPIINRGTFLRVNTIDKSIEKFLTQECAGSERVQVVSLGAGFDTRYFYLRDLLKSNNVKYFEIDFPKLIQQKISLILSKEELNKELSNVELDERKLNLNSLDYSLISGDLKEFDKIIDSMKLFGFNADIPTYFISECVLIYLEPKHSDYIIEWIASNCKLSQIITYEQVGPEDDFGKMMLQNLQMRGIDLKGIYKYPSVESQIERFKKLGFSDANCITLLQSERELLSQDEINRLNALERLDELEEWELICNHYIFAEAKNRN